ncbi:riboflavin synthase [Loigolactobacillus coryniformis]|jgi:riboflavin synthase|uniref:Riboflavin synthase n=1 Tax=Loigolactobacillus coryniformis subsp. torquens DSM 20004 = KCTC 3535 TaxID=1423822 RepID=A0A2D1KPS0_9LACO|nr:riboflavin synthase [Loigolactobacillus coryniformis]ATO44116.1 riboflavin synthase subunit alpha [Loigolactobacillus coryniformis subsp. torquens DSM 20004 = KCTC 3535]KRK77014.1 riboflavin synthase subunit alpha [Loigolactobacillus coryniformis subsp. torquens DSM 20004 = KCTC 3535]MCL5458513.1 riboflavin synthase [Loigolactobacillus coryniformis]
MFTGIIRDVGTVVGIVKKQETEVLTIKTALLQQGDCHLGDSIAINGTCLTIAAMTATTFAVDVMPETYQRTNLGTLKVGTKVDLEPALGATDKLDGHFVLGHVDTTTKMIKRQRNQNAIILTFATPALYANYLVEKGSIALDGVSLTLVKVSTDCFTVSLIPYTQAHTVLEDKHVGEPVNVETDILGKYTVQLAKGSTKL